MRNLGLREYGIRRCPSRLRIGLVALFLAVVAGCVRPEPFVNNVSEFDRRNIGRPAPVPGVVQICYHGPATTPETVLRLAEEECAKFGKTPQMIKQEISDCPIATPVAANYLCCPTLIDPNTRYRCSAAGGHVERLNNEQVREALAAQRRVQQNPTK